MTPKSNEKLKQVHRECREETLCLKLQQDIGYDIRQVKMEGNQHCYMKQLMNIEREGKYVVELKYSNRPQTHVVGIDCDSGLIWDLSEFYALELTKKNLNYCAGKTGSKLTCIPHCYEILINSKKRKYKHEKVNQENDNKKRSKK